MVTGSTVFTTPGFHDVILTNSVVGGVREVKAYLDGHLELVSDTDQLNLDNASNPGHLLHFFLDNRRRASPAGVRRWADRSAGDLRRRRHPVGRPSSPKRYALLLVGLAAVGAAARQKGAPEAHRRRG